MTWRLGPHSVVGSNLVVRSIRLWSARGLDRVDGVQIRVGVQRLEGTAWLAGYRQSASGIDANTGLILTGRESLNYPLQVGDILIAEWDGSPVAGMVVEFQLTRTGGVSEQAAESRDGVVAGRDIERPLFSAHAQDEEAVARLARQINESGVPDVSIPIYLFDEAGSGGATTFLELTDTPADYASHEGEYVRVKADGTGLEFFFPPGSSTFDSLSDTPAAKVAGQLVRADGSGALLEYVAPTAGLVGADPAGSAAAVQSNLDDHEGDNANPHAVTASQAGADPVGAAQVVQDALDLHEADTGNPHGVTAAQAGADPVGSAQAVQDDLDTHKGDTSIHYPDAASDGKLYGRKDAAWEEVPGGGGVTDFLGLTDTPTEYLDHAGDFVAVDGDESALIFRPAPPGVVTYKWRFSTDTAETDPGAGHVKINNADPTLVTEVYIAQTDLRGQDRGIVIDSLGPGDYVAISRIGHVEFATYVASGHPTDNGTWWTIPVTYRRSNGVIPNNRRVYVSFAHATFREFIELLDTPADYAGNAGKIPAVNAGEDALEFIDPPSGGGAPYSWESHLGPWVFQNTMAVDGESLWPNQLAFPTNLDPAKTYVLEVAVHASAEVSASAICYGKTGIRYDGTEVARVGWKLVGADAVGSESSHDGSFFIVQRFTGVTTPPAVEIYDDRYSQTTDTFSTRGEWVAKISEVAP